MGKPIRMIVITIAIAGLLAAGGTAFSSVIAGANAAEKDTSPVMDFKDYGDVRVMNSQERGTSDLIRTMGGVSMNIATTDLPVGAYTVWWVIFNNPSGCSDGICGSNDTGKPKDGPNVAEGSVLWATGGIVGPDRMGHFSASLGLGEGAAPGPLLRGPALTNPMGAEIHLVLRYHGPTMWADTIKLANQITTVNGSCLKEGGTFGCFDPQSTAHK